MGPGACAASDGVRSRYGDANVGPSEARAQRSHPPKSEAHGEAKTLDALVN